MAYWLKGSLELESLEFKRLCSVFAAINATELHWLVPASSVSQPASQKKMDFCVIRLMVGGRPEQSLGLHGPCVPVSSQLFKNGQ